MPTTTLPRCRFSLDSGELAQRVVNFQDPEWSTLLRRTSNYILTTRTLALRMRALTLLAIENRNLHSLVRSVRSW